MLLKNLRFRDLENRNSPIAHYYENLRRHNLGDNEVLDNGVPELLEGKLQLDTWR